MTITTTNARNMYACDGVATVFPVTFKYMNQTDFLVFVVSPTGVITQAALNIDYTVNTFINFTGEIVFLAPPANLSRLVIIRVHAVTQETDSTGKEEFTAAEIESIADNIMFIVQEIWDKTQRSLKLVDTDVSGSGRYDAGGNRITNVGDPVDDDDVVTKSWGLVNLGLPGPPGNPGTAGSVWRSGAGAPAGGLGVVTDWYLNTTNGDVYEKTGPAAYTLRDNLTGPAGPGGDALVANPLSQFAATTSLQLKNTITDETGSGALVFANAPALVNPTGIVKGDVGLGNVDNTSDATKHNNTALTGIPTAPTAAPGTNTTQLSTTAFVKAAIDVVLGGVGAAFDTLSEIATDLGLKMVKSANLSDVANVTTARDNLGLGTANSPQFTGIELGAAADTTLTRASAGNMNIEGNLVYRAGGTDVPVADGGTGASTAGAAATNLGLGTGDSPQFAAVNVGNAADTTIGRTSAGIINVEGNDVLMTTTGEKLGQRRGINTQTVNYTFALTDMAKVCEMNNAAARTFTIPLNATVPFPVGAWIDVARLGAGEVDIAATGGVTLRSENSMKRLNLQNSGGTLVQRAIDDWWLFGSLKT